MKSEVLVNREAELWQETERYMAELKKCETEDQCTMCIAHHIINIYDITDKYNRHEADIQQNGIAL